MLTPIDEAEWKDAGAKTEALVMGRAFPGMKQGVAARALGFSQSTLSRVFRGKMALSEQFARLADTALTARAGSDDAPEFVYQAGEIIEIWFRSTSGGPPTNGEERVDDLSALNAADSSAEVERIRTPLSRRRAVVTTAFVGLVLFAGAAIWRMSTQAKSEAAAPGSPSLSSCSVTPIEFDPEIVDQYQGWGERMVQEYLDVRIEYVDLCPVELVKENLDGQVLIQRMEDADGRQMVLLATSSANAIGLNRAQWISFVEARPLADVEVLPLRFKVGVQGSRIAMSDGFELIAAEGEHRHVLVSEAVVDAWIEQGGPDGPFGWPMSHVYSDGSRLRSDFEGGYFLVDRPQEEDPVVTPVPDRSSGLSNQDAPRLLALPDGSTWLITEAGERQWVMDAATNSCLRRTFDVPEVVSGEELAQFSLGQPAVCG